MKLNVICWLVVNYYINEYIGHIIINVIVDNANKYEYKLPILLRMNYFNGYIIYNVKYIIHNVKIWRYVNIDVVVSIWSNGIIPW